MCPAWRDIDSRAYPERSGQVLANLRVANLFPLSQMTDPDSTGAYYAVGLSPLLCDASGLSAVLLSFCTPQPPSVSTPRWVSQRYGRRSPDMPSGSRPIPRGTSRIVRLVLFFFVVSSTASVGFQSSLIQGAPPSLDVSGSPVPVAKEGLRLGTLSNRIGCPISSIVFTADGLGIMAIGTNGRLSHWTLEGTLAREWLMPDHPARVITRIGLEGHLIVGGDAGGLLLSAQHKVLQTYRGVFIRALAFNEKTQTLAMGNQLGLVHLFDYRTGQLRRVLRQHRASITGLAFAPDGRYIISGDADGRLATWDEPAGQITSTLKIGQPVTAVAVTPDGLHVIVAEGTGNVGDRRARVTISGIDLKGDIILADNLVSIQAIAVSHDGTLIAAGDMKGDVRIWQLATRRLIHAIEAHFGGVKSVEFSPTGGLLVSGGNDGIIRIWDVVTGGERWPHQGGRSAVLAICSNATSDRFVTGGLDGTVAVWNRDTPSVPVWTTRVGRQVVGLGWGRDSIVVDEGSNCYRLDPQTGRQVRIDLASGRGYTERSILSADGSWLVRRERRSVGAGIALYDLGAGRERFVLGGVPPEVIGMAMCYDRKEVAIAGTNGTIESPVMIQWRNSGTGDLVGRWDMGEGWSGPMGVSRDGRWMSIARSGGVFRLRSKDRGDKDLSLTKEDGEISAISFAHDGRSFAVGTSNGVVSIVECRSGKERCRTKLHRGTIRVLVFRDDSKVVLSGSDDTTAFAFDITGCGTEGKHPDEIGLADGPATWKALGGDARTAFAAMARFARGGTWATAVLGDRLVAEETVTGARLRQWLLDLEDASFEIREKADASLARLNHRIEKQLRSFGRENHSAEALQRVRKLLDRLEDGPPEFLQKVRGVEALERLGNLEAKTILERLAGGAAEGEVTREAASSLERLGRKGGK
jgi:WD40 repeat protein